MGRVKILTGVERRRVWTDEDKLCILEEVETSGSGVAEIARRKAFPSCRMTSRACARSSPRRQKNWRVKA